MQIKLTRKQYKNLLKIVYLGNWLINAIRTNAEGDERIKKYDDIEQYIFSFAKEAGLEKYIEFDKKFNRFFPTREFDEDEEILQYIDEYNNDNFWEELIDRLAQRDFVRKYSQEAIQKMTIEERIEKEYPFIEKYAQEFEKSGLKNLRTKKNLKQIFNFLKK